MAVLTRIPHFDLPFRFVDTSGGLKVAENDQDSYEEVKDCVEAIIRYRRGQRPDAPEFGIDHQVFTLDVDSARILDQIVENEPRADTSVQDEIDAIDELVRHVTVGLADIEDKGGTNVQH